MNFKFLPWNRDQWFSKQGTLIKYDKLEHLLLAVLGVVLLVYIFDQEILFSSAVIFMIGIIWEIRDGLITNGQGFSKKDLISDFIGILSASILIAIM
jgi:hypothetical protein